MKRLLQDTFYPNQVTRLTKNVQAWNKWREDNPGIRIDLRNTDLRNTDLRKANLINADFDGAELNGADLREANLNGAKLIRAYINKANFSDAKLNGANFKESKLKEANFSDARLINANFNRAELSKAKFIRANLSGAELNRAKLSDADLSGADLSGAEFIRAYLSDANISTVQALATNFNYATLTGVCIKDWNINTDTQLDNVTCLYVYLEKNRQNRLPSDSNKNFELREFSKLIEGVSNTVELILRGEIESITKQLKESYPCNTPTEQKMVADKAIEKINNNPNLKKRIINAVQESGLAGLEKALDNTIVGVMIAGAIRGWLEAESD